MRHTYQTQTSCQPSNQTPPCRAGNHRHRRLSHPSAAQCARANAAARELALMPSHFTDATTPRSLATGRRLTRDTHANSRSYLVPITKTPPPSRGHTLKSAHAAAIMPPLPDLSAANGSRLLSAAPWLRWW
jgi:hypothetical protein